MAERPFAERLWEAVDEAMEAYDLPTELGEMLKEDLKKALDVKGKARPGYELGGVGRITFNLVDAVTEPGETAWKTVKKVFGVSYRPPIPLLWTDAEEDVWRKAFTTEWVDAQGYGVLPRCVEDAVLRWNEGARSRITRLIRERVAIQDNPGLVLAMARQLSRAGVNSVGGVGITTIIADAGAAERAVSGRLIDADLAVRAGDRAGAEKLRREADKIQMGDLKFDPATSNIDPHGVNWAETAGFEKRKEVTKEFERQSRLGSRQNAPQGAHALANSPEAQFLRYWKNRRLYFQTLNFLNTLKDEGVWGTVKAYAWNEAVKLIFGLEPRKGAALLTRFRYRLYPAHALAWAKEQALKRIGIRGITAERITKGIATRLTNLRQRFAGFMKRKIRDPIKKGFEWVRDQVIRKAVNWLITKLGLRVILTKIGAIIGGAIGTVVPGIGNVLAAIAGGILSFIGGLIAEKLWEPIQKAALYVFGGALGCLAVVGFGGALFIVVFITGSIFAPGAGGPGVGPGPIPLAEVEVEKEVCPVDDFGQVLEDRCASWLKLPNPEVLALTVEWRVYVKNNTSDSVVITVMDERCGDEIKTVTVEGGKREFAFSCPEQFLVGTEDTTFTNATEGMAPIGVTVHWGMAILVIGTPAHTFPSGWPTSGTITQGPNVPCPSHGSMEAIDIANPAMPSVYTTHSGEVVEAGWLSFSCGNGVKIYAKVDSRIFFSQYCHLSQVGVSEGDQVTDGQPIGRMGSTGDSSGSHLHYSFIGLPMAPPYIPRPVCCCREDLDDDGSWQDEDAQYCGSSSPDTVRCNASVSH